MHRWEIIIGIIHAECQKWPIKSRVVKLLLIIESFQICIDFHLKWHPFGVPWKINGGISEWTAGDYLASSLQPFLSQSVRFSGRKYRNICSKSVIGCRPNHLKLTSECALVFTKNIKNAKFIKKFESESWFKSFFTPSCILNCIKMLYFCIGWLIRYAFIPSTWQVQTWVSSGFKGIWFQISKVKFF